MNQLSLIFKSYLYRGSYHPLIFTIFPFLGRWQYQKCAALTSSGPLQWTLRIGCDSRASHSPDETAKMAIFGNITLSRQWTRVAILTLRYRLDVAEGPMRLPRTYVRTILADSDIGHCDARAAAWGGAEGTRSLVINFYYMYLRAVED